MALTKAQIASKTKQAQSADKTLWNPFESSDMPGCCGVDVVHGFGNGKSLWASLFQAIYVRKDFGLVNTLIATTIPYQTDAVKALKFCGFKKAGSSRNPNTNHVVTTWVLHKASERN